MILEQASELNSGKACWQKIFRDYREFFVLSRFDVPNQEKFCLYDEQPISADGMPNC